MLEQAGNRLLSLDAEANAKLVDFTDKVIHIHINDLQLDYFILFPGGSLVVKEQSERPATATISGKLSAFLAAATQENTGDAFFTGELHFSGEINTARQFQEFIQSLQIDWQEPISQIFGDLAGQTISTGIEKAGSFCKAFLTNLKQDVPEYLQEEIQVTPSAAEQEIFFEQIDLVRSQTDRLNARIERLKNHD